MVSGLVVCLRYGGNPIALGLRVVLISHMGACHFLIMKTGGSKGFFVLNRGNVVFSVCSTA